MAYRYEKPLAPFEYQSGFVAPPVEFLKGIMDSRQAVYNEHMKTLAASKMEGASQKVAPGDMNMRNELVQNAFADTYDQLNSVDNPNMVTDAIYDEVVNFKKNPFWNNAADKYARYTAAVQNRDRLAQEGKLVDKRGDIWNNWVNAPSTVNGQNVIGDDLGFLEKDEYKENIAKQFRGFLQRGREGGWFKGSGLLEDFILKKDQTGWKESDYGTIKKLLTRNGTNYDFIQDFLAENPSFVHDADYANIIDKDGKIDTEEVTDFIIKTIIDKSQYSSNTEKQLIPTNNVGGGGGGGSDEKLKISDVFRDVVGRGELGKTVKSVLNDFNSSAIGRIFNPTSTQLTEHYQNVMTPKKGETADVKYVRNILKSLEATGKLSYDKIIQEVLKVDPFTVSSMSDPSNIGRGLPIIPFQVKGDFDPFLHARDVQNPAVKKQMEIYLKTGSEKALQTYAKLTGRRLSIGLREDMNIIKARVFDEYQKQAVELVETYGDNLHTFTTSDEWVSPESNKAFVEYLSNSSVIGRGTYLTGDLRGKQVELTYTGTNGNPQQENKVDFNGITYDGDIGIIVSMNQPGTKTPVQVSLPLTEDIIRGLKKYKIMDNFEGAEYHDRTVSWQDGVPIKVANFQGSVNTFRQDKKFSTSTGNPYFTYSTEYGKPLTEKLVVKARAFKQFQEFTGGQGSLTEFNEYLRMNPQYQSASDKKEYEFYSKGQAMEIMSLLPNMSD